MPAVPRPPSPRSSARRATQPCGVYQEFLDDPKWSPGTRHAYASRVKLFRWAEGRGLTLPSIDPFAVAAYASETTAEKSPRPVEDYLTPVYGVLGRLATAGVLATDPSPKRHPNAGTLPLAERVSSPPLGSPSLVNRPSPVGTTASGRVTAPSS